MSEPEREFAEAVFANYLDEVPQVLPAGTELFDTERRNQIFNELYLSQRFKDWRSKFFRELADEALSGLVADGVMKCCLEPTATGMKEVFSLVDEKCSDAPAFSRNQRNKSK